MEYAKKNKSIRKILIRALLTHILIIAGVWFGFGQVKSDSEEEKRIKPAQPTFALLVGITNYKNKTIPKIDGCENNVPLLAETLISDYGFDEKNVVTLVNEKATKDAITSTFESHLTGNAKKAQESGKEAVTLYYFCGHGSQFPDQDKDENDEMDETFVAYDSRTGDVFDILDDELDDLKSDLRQYTANTTLILESCHSGTGSRGDFDDERYISEEVDSDNRTRPAYKRKFPPTKDSDALTYTEIAASMSANTAKSESATYCKCEKPYSLMTKALVEGLKRSTHTTTYRGLMREVSDAVAKRSIQSPQVEGNRDAILFGGAAKRAKPYIEIEKVLPNNQIAIRAGRVHGLNVGSQISVYASSSLTNTGNEGWLTNGIVDRVGTAVSVVQLPKPEENSKVTEVKITSHVVLASPVFGGGSISVELNPDKTRTLSKAEKSLQEDIKRRLIDQDLVKNQIIEFESGEGAGDESSKGIVRLRKGKIGIIFRDHKERMVPLLDKTSCSGNELVTHPAAARFPEPDREVYYLDDGGAGGTPLFGRTFDPADPRLAKYLSETIKSFAYQQNLRGLDNAVSTLGKQVEVTLQTIPEEAILESCKDGKKAYARNEPKFTGFEDIKENKVPVNSYFMLKVKNVSEEIRKKDDKFASGQAFHIAILHLKNDGEIKNLLGSKGANDAVGYGKEVTVFLKTKEPIGIERYIIVISEDLVDFGFYEQTLRTRKGGVSILERLLTQSGKRTRDTGVVIKDEPDSWAVISIDLEIQGDN